MRLPISPRGLVVGVVMSDNFKIFARAGKTKKTGFAGRSSLFFSSARDRNRTCKGLLPLPPQSSASASSATRAWVLGLKSLAGNFCLSSRWKCQMERVDLDNVKAHAPGVSGFGVVGAFVKCSCPQMPRGRVREKAGDTGEYRGKIDIARARRLVVVLMH